MARGKIQIKLIENTTNRQVTYSKRRSGLFKKANELTVLCDAKVSIIMISSTKKIHEWISPSTTQKQMIDQYQKIQNVDLWNTQYEKMQEELRKLEEINANLRLEVSKRRKGEGLSDMTLQELIALEAEIEDALKIIRERKMKAIGNQIETAKKKKRNQEDINKRMVQLSEIRELEPHYGLVENGGGGIDPNLFVGYPNNGIGGARVFAFRFDNNPADPNHLHTEPGPSDLTTFPFE